MPSLLNRAYGRSQFWDGRAATLEEQALHPIENPAELGGGLAEVLDRLRSSASYTAQFQTAFGAGPSATNLAMALAAFERTLLSGNSKVDRFIHGDTSALTAIERHGLWLYESRAQCWRCHSGRNFTDEEFHNTGIGWGVTPADHGRFELTGAEKDRGRFKTPTLRDVARTAPYMHDGGLATLEEVIEFYNRGGRPNPNLDPAMKPLELSPDEVRALAAFLEALSGAPE